MRPLNLKRLSEQITKAIKPVHLALFTLIFAAFIIWVLPNVSAATKIATGSNQAPDTAFFYTAQSLYQIAGEYGPAGRSYYIVSRFTFDIVWPIAYGLFLTAALAITFNPPKPSSTPKLNHPNLSNLSNLLNRLSILNLLPLLGVAFDYLENISTAYTMYRYPNTTLIAYLAPPFTAIKWVMIYGAFATLILGILLRIILHVGQALTKQRKV